MPTNGSCFSPIIVIFVGMKLPLLKSSLLLILMLLSCFIAAMPQDTDSDDQNNPLLEVIGLPYCEYHDLYHYLVDSLLHTDSLSRCKLMRLFEEVAIADNLGEWDINYRNVVYHVRFYESRNGGFVAGPDYTAQQFAGDLLTLARVAEQKGFPLLNIRSLFYAAETYRVFLEDYEQAFNYYLEASSRMEGLCTKTFPIRPSIYNELANLYYTFREYNDAAYYYRMLLEDPDTRENSSKLHYAAMNGLGLCYRYGDKDYDRSDSYFMRLINSSTAEPKLWHDTWTGIAMGNIGYNYHLRGDLDTALSYLIPAIDKVTRPNDYPYRSVCATRIANIYLEMQEPATAKKYIDMALDYHYQSSIPEKESNLYKALFYYYAQTGNRTKAIAYHDSVLIVQNMENETFSGLILRRVEQRLRVTDHKIHEQKLHTEVIHSQEYQRTAILVSVTLVIILGLLIVTIIIYRHKRKAYRELVRRSQNWAGVKVSADPAIADKHQTVGKDEMSAIENATEKAMFIPEESDKLIIDSIEKAMSDDKLYKRTDLTLDTLAVSTGHNRYYISTAMNRYLEKNFYTYINEYRIKEAVRLISDPTNNAMTIEAIAFESGFNDRQSLHRAFKKVTGLSPGDFRRNMNGE